MTDRIIPWLRPKQRGGPGRPPVVSDAELVCLAVTQVLLRCHDERHWLRAAPSRVGHLSPRLLSQPTYNRRLRGVAWLEAAPRWLADHTPVTAEQLRLADGTPVVCGRSRRTAMRSALFGYAGYGHHDTSHHCFYGTADCCWSPLPTAR